MIRIILTILLPLVLPAALYVAWAAAARKFDMRGGDLPAFPLAWLLAAGVALVAITLFVFDIHYGRSEQGVYVPPHTEDGRVVPGHVVPDAPASR